MKTHSTSGRGRRRWTAGAGVLGLAGAALLTACSSGGSSGGSAAGAPAAAAKPAATAATATRAACAAAVASDWVNIPGIDPDGPRPAAAQLTAWATPLQAHLTTLRAGVPATLTGQVDTLATTVRGAQAGKPVNTDDPSLNAALAAVDAWVHDSCGYATLDVTDGGSGLAGVPATLPAGPVVLKFTNTATDASKAGFILLLGKVHSGQTVTAAAVRAGKADLQNVADIVAAAQPTGAAPAYGLTTLRPGHYIVASPTGHPPAFTGTLADDLDVS